MKKSTISLCALSGLMAVSSVAPVLAEEFSFNIDPDKKGSITLYKYESVDGKFAPGHNVTEDIDQVDAEKKPIAGVKYDYLKIGDLVQIADTDTNTNGLYYTLDTNFLNEMQAYGISIPKVTIRGTDYYTAENINAALKTMHTTTAGYGESVDGTETPNEKMIKYVDANGTAMPDTDEDGKTTVTDLDQGLYIVAEVGQPATSDDGVTQYISKPSAPFLMPIPMTNTAVVDGHQPGTVWQYDLVAYPKSEMISIRKDIIADGNDLADGVTEDRNGLVVKTDKNIGDSVKFLLTLDVPALQPQDAVEGSTTANKNRKYIINDTMTNGLTIDDLSAANFDVKLGVAPYNSEAGENLKQLEHGVDYTVEATGDASNPGFKLTMTEAGLAKFDELTADSKLYVSYSARVDMDAAEATGAIKKEGNEYKLTYGTSVSKDYEFESNKDVEVFTYEVNLTKTFTHDVADKTQVTFNVAHIDPESQEETLIEFVEEAPGVYHVYDKKEEAEGKTTTVKVNSEGKLCLKGLDDGKYSIKELTTIKGYNLLRDPIILTITADHPENGAITKATIKNADQEVEIGEGLENGLVNFTVVNNESISALHTGGNGWSGITYLVAAGAISAGVLVIAKKRKEAKSN